MDMESNWNSLEVAKLLVSTLTPVVVVILGIWIARVTKRLEQRQWTHRRIIERRIDVYDEIAPLLNDLVVYFTFVGHWKELQPIQLVEAKRILDRRVHISESLFSEQFLLSYSSFIQLCFATYQGWGIDARLRGDPKLHIKAAGSSWDTAWTELFTAERDWVEPSRVYNSYKQLMAVLSEELQLNLGHHTQTEQRRTRKMPHTQLDEVTPIAPEAERKSSRVVFRRTLPADLNGEDPAAIVACQSNRKVTYHTNQKAWPKNTTLRVHMSGGSTEQQDFVMTYASHWTAHAMLTFEFVRELPAEIRITFDPSLGSWSYVGTDCLEAPITNATMNVASVDQGAILHLFGLVLGLAPTFQNPAGSLEWDLEAIYRDLSVCDEYSTIESVEKFVSKYLCSDQINGTEFDFLSVMLMPQPDYWCPKSGGARMNTELSELDKSLVSQLYPWSE